jgi:hypothetical protein
MSRNRVALVAFESSWIRKNSVPSHRNSCEYRYLNSKHALVIQRCAKLSLRAGRPLKRRLRLPPKFPCEVCQPWTTKISGQVGQLGQVDCQSIYPDGKPQLIRKNLGHRLGDQLRVGEHMSNASRHQSYPHNDEPQCSRVGGDVERLQMPEKFA